MDTLYFDWSMRRGVITIYDDDPEVYEIYPSLDVMLDHLEEPTRIIGEATFESFNLNNRLAFIDRCVRDGHQLLTVPTRETTKARFRAGFGVKAANQTWKTDLEDVQAIRYEVRNGMHLKRPGAPDERIQERRLAVNGRLMELRSTGTLVAKARSEGYNFIPDQEIYAQNIINQLPAFSTLTDTQRKALGNSDGTGYSSLVVATVGVVAEFAESRDDFDRLAGLHAHAYGSQARSNLMFWQWAGGGPRRKLNKDTRKRDDLTLSEYRRELRWLFRQIKSLG